MSMIVLFDSGNSYVVRKLPAQEIKGHQVVDKLGRTNFDRKYLEDYEVIFLAASEGDAKKCQEVINRGFRDFDAESFGRYGTKESGKFFGISPRKVAKIQNHAEILELFDRHSSKISTQFPEKSSALLKQKDVAHFSAEEKKAYDDFMEFIKDLSKKDYFDKESAIQSALTSSYLFEEMMEKMEQFRNLKFPQLLGFVRNRIDQPFAEKKKLERPHLMALRDFFDTFVSKV